jgi:hypothetical protein
MGEETECRGGRLDNNLSRPHQPEQHGTDESNEHRGEQ